MSLVAASARPNYEVEIAPRRRQKLSLMQTAFLAQKAQGKLSKEAAKGDHDLRLLVGHAIMLSCIIADLANAEKEQERWLSRSPRSTRDDEEPEQEHIETIVKDPEGEWEATYANSFDGDSDSDEEEQLKSTTVTTREVDADLEKYDGAYADNALSRTASRDYYYC
jgi:hypothetical protein